MSAQGSSGGDSNANRAALAMARWLLIVAAMVVLIVVVGGITRLTESGLSITEWKPLSGIVPPLSQAAWDQEFAHYRQIDQYAAVHAGMTLSDFKGIFFWEYIHRVLGRLIGMAVAFPLIWFWLRGQIPQGYKPRLFALLSLIGLQGTLGWLMVHSGLQKGMTEVAPLWLAAHLVTALFTLSGLVWTAMDLIALAHNPAARPARLTGFAALTGLVLAVQLVWGALMAGLRAGRVTNQWPLMNGTFWPGASQSGESLGHAITADPAIVHFIHRWWAWVVVALLIMLARRVKAAGDRRASIAIHSAFGTQILLGIATVMSDVALPLAVLHQLVGALLVAATAWGAHAVGRVTGRQA
ncbi:MAG: COX15/CtaA family protein [Sphingomonadales bacterium]|nr:COX15/CtaA family protein [Sphingomonadales bacterium]MDE2171893.1 COX15/CtaA family protein [Sphingomonadales bacterium]